MCRITCSSCIYDLAFKPDGTQLLVAIGNRVIVYDPNDGSVIISLKDKTVIVWSDQHEGLLKYTHNEAIQCLAFSTVSIVLLSCSVTDFGIWAQNEKNVSKQKVQSRCTCCGWSADGQYYAIGFYDGTISIRSAVGSTPTGEEISKVERPGREPIWSLQFTLVSSIGMHGELLVVADWAPSIGFYGHDNGQVMHKSDKQLDYDPTSVHLFTNGCFFLATGSNKKLNLHTREGGDLGAMAQLDAWPWCMAFRQKPYCVVVGCVDGSLACYQLMLNTIHALHKDRYAFRENQTDVVIQQLQRQKSTRIRCNDLVRKVAIYNNRLAIQLTDKVLIYRQSSGEKEGEQLDYKLLDRINQSFDCSLLVVCTNHVILCQDRRLTCFDLKGIKQREWIMESLIRYIKVVGGPPGRETILVGMRYGLVSKIFVDNPFPVEVVRLKSMIRCVDISLSKKKLATVDEEGICVIYDTETKEILNQEPNMSSVAFNCENEDLVCYSGFGNLNIKSHWFTPFTQRLEPSHQGFVVGFMGKCVYILHMYSMQCLEIPLTSQLLQFLDHKMFKEAYDLASLGVTERDWKMLGNDALENMEFTIAKKSFYRIRDCRSLLLINELEELHTRGSSVEEMRALLYAYNRRFREAAQLLQAMNAEQKALEMFADLRMFDQAQEFLANSSPETQKLLLRKKAEWAHNSNDMTLAADMLMASGDYDRAIRIMMSNDWIDKLHAKTHADYTTKLKDAEENLSSQRNSMDRFVKILPQGQLSSLDKRVVHLIACACLPFSIVDQPCFKPLLTGSHNKWNISLEKCHVFLCDEGGNMRKAFETEGFLHADCADHKLNLVVNKSIFEEQAISETLKNFRALVSHFKHSSLAKDRLEYEQKQLNLPLHKLKQDEPTRWNATYYMCQSLIEQQMAVEIVINAARKLDRSEANLLREIGTFLAKKGEFTAASTIFTRINDVKSIIGMHMSAGHWEDALALAERNPTMNSEVYLPYARWLAERDRFDEAQLAYSKAGQDQEALQVLEELTQNAVKESRYSDASCYYRIMASQLLEHQPVGITNELWEKRWMDLLVHSDIYFAYEPIFKYVIEPFTNKSLDILFNMARFLALHRDVNYVSRVIVLFTLVKLSRMFANYKTARQALEQLRLLRAPLQYQSLIDIASLEIRAKPFSDAEEFQPMCYSNPILGGHMCVHCDTEFVYSFTTFEVLPVIKFELEDGLNTEEAIEMINSEPSDGSFNVSQIAMNKKRTGIPKLGKQQLLELDRNVVFICSAPVSSSSPDFLRARFYIKVIPEINISKCSNCHKMFHHDDFQMAILQFGQCPVCRVKIESVSDSYHETDEN
uniref:Intraflagellar transport protein 122 homolog n=1 Tax=Ditylenchus dipsaci TaxID=166011 RepID=A0A915D5G1_9BILA